MHLNISQGFLLLGERLYYEGFLISNYLFQMYILAAFAFILSVAAFSANYPESSDPSLHLDEGDLETLEPQSPAAINRLSLLLARNAGFTTDLEYTDISAVPDNPRDFRSPPPWYKNPHSTEHYYKPQQTLHRGESHLNSYHQYNNKHQTIKITN